MKSDQDNAAEIGILSLFGLYTTVSKVLSYAKQLGS